MTKTAGTAAEAKIVTPRTPAGRIGEWVFLCAVVLTALAVGAACLPPRFRLLGLLAALFGLLCGWIMGRIAVLLRLSSTRWLMVSAGVLTAAAFAGQTWEARRHFAEEMASRFDRAEKTILQPQGGQVSSGPRLSPGSSVEEQEAIRQAREIWLAENTSFAAYLQHRVKALGEWPLWGAALFWGGEILLAGLCGGWVYRRVSRAATSSVT